MSINVKFTFSSLLSILYSFCIIICGTYAFIVHCHFCITYSNLIRRFLFVKKKWLLFTRLIACYDVLVKVANKEILSCNVHW